MRIVRGHLVNCEVRIPKAINFSFSQKIIILLVISVFKIRLSIMILLTKTFEMVLDRN